jgi:hypothetical protein
MAETDLISRQAAIDALGEKPLAWTEGEYELGLQNQWQSDVDALNGLPSAQPEPRWIPCSERLPEARRSVILSTKNWTGEGCYWETTAHHVIWKGYRWNVTYWDGEVIAWMPLPEPYKEGADE